MNLPITESRLRARETRPQVELGTGRASNATAAPSFAVRWASTPSEVAEAQRLRFKVFVDELGARLSDFPGRPSGHDIDEFDTHCLHLLVVSKAGNGGARGVDADEVVATCRVLTPAGARRAGRLYSDDEFDLSPLRDILPGAIEMGRVCVAPAWRNGLLILALWRELGKLMSHEGMDTLIGCSSVGLLGRGDLAAQLWHRLQSTYLVEPTWRVRPWKPLPLQSTPRDSAVQVPPMMRGYLRCGGRLLGPPAFDANFNTADFPMLLRLCDLPVRYGKRVLQS